jgi:hypothetical protein
METIFTLVFSLIFRITRHLRSSDRPFVPFKADNRDSIVPVFVNRAALSAPQHSKLCQRATTHIFRTWLQKLETHTILRDTKQNESVACTCRWLARICERNVHAHEALGSCKCSTLATVIVRMDKHLNGAVHVTVPKLRCLFKWRLAREDKSFVIRGGGNCLEVLTVLHSYSIFLTKLLLRNFLHLMNATVCDAPLFVSFFQNNQQLNNKRDIGRSDNSVHRAINLSEDECICLEQISKNFLHPWHTLICQRHVMARHKSCLTKRGYETVHDHKYVFTCKSIPHKNAGIWKQNITHV